MRRAALIGSFDPPTVAHHDLAKRVLALGFDLTIGVATNPQKVAAFSPETRVAMLRTLLPQLEVSVVEGLTADWLEHQRIDILVRGIRDASDLSHESRMAWANGTLKPSKLETLFLLTRPALAHVSSSLVREIMLFDPSRVADFVPAATLPWLTPGEARPAPCSKPK